MGHSDKYSLVSKTLNRILYIYISRLLQQTLSKLPRNLVDIFNTQHTNLELVLLVVAGREAGLTLGEAQLGAAEATVHRAVAARAAGPQPEAVQHVEAGWLAADLDRGHHQYPGHTQRRFCIMAL